MAAVLACGSGAVLSHHSAAALWEIRKASREEHRAGEGKGLNAAVHISVPSSAGRVPRDALVVHRVAALLPSECTLRRGIPTTPERTILDLAPGLQRRQLERAIDEAERLRLCGTEELVAIVDTMPAAPEPAP